MPTGAITGYIDVAQVVLYAFWVFFAGLIFYLRREDKREGYPLDSDLSERSSRVSVVGYPRPPEPKQYRLPHGQGTREAPHPEKITRDIPGTKPSAPWLGAPLVPTGDPMRDGVGPASYPEREDVPDLALDGTPKVVPMRVATDFVIEHDDPDPRGMDVVAADGKVVGTVKDLWVDRAEPRILFYEVALNDAAEAAADSDGSAEDEADAATEANSDAAADAPEAATKGGPNPLLPYGFTRISFGKKQIRVSSIMAEHFAHVPRTASPDQITRLEEDRITAYYAGGHLYAHQMRQEPLI
ncbi:MAG: photosynthetic reaction center subunit H [Gammaproteobacteria bacterium]|jgi:photosynthetic reaction center H subunit|nr:photosynthetic reaction center subunit H [Gammaproteobacteria bacterium]